MADVKGNLDDFKKQFASQFVTDLPEGSTELQLGWKTYKPQFCAKLGGVQGVLIDSSTEQSDIAKNPDNPDGNFTAFIFQLTKPCPCVAGNVDKETPPEDVEYIEGEVNDRVMVVGSAQIEEELARYLTDPDWFAELALIPIGKIKTKKGGMWNFRVARVRNVPRHEIMVGEKAWRPSLPTGDAKRPETLPSASS